MCYPHTILEVDRKIGIYDKQLIKISTKVKRSFVTGKLEIVHIQNIRLLSCNFVSSICISFNNIGIIIRPTISFKRALEGSKT